MAKLLMYISAAAGIWLIFSPAVFDYVGTTAATLDRIVGPFIATFAIIALGDATRNVRFWNVPPAVAMVVLAFVLAYPTGATVGNTLAMLVVIGSAFYPRRIEVGLAGGWAALFRKDPYNTRDGSADAPANPTAAR
jgi:hypothetical protein